jgi:hypothetical protein
MHISPDNLFRFVRFLIAPAMLVMVLSAVAQDPASRDLAERYIDELNGFSLRPPAGGQRVTTPREKRLAEWIRQSPDGTSTLWLMSVSRRTFTEKHRDLARYSQTLTAELQRRGAEVQQVRMATLAGQPAIRCGGTLAEAAAFAPASAKVKVEPLQFRQAWILLAPGEFLVVEWVARASAAESLNRTWGQVVESIRLFDTRGAIERKKAAARRAQELLWDKLTPEVFRERLPDRPRWYLMHRNGKAVGWMKLIARPTRREGRAGYEIQTWSMIQMPDQPTRLIRRRMFIEPRLAGEIWRAHIQVGDGPDAVLLVEDGLRKLGLVVCTLGRNDQMQTQQTRLPDAVKDIYLPKAVGAILPSLIDLKPGTSYLFAEYTSAENDFVERELQVGQVETITWRGRDIQTVRLTEQTGREKPIALWVDGKGNVVRTRTTDGLVTELASQAGVLRNFPRANEIIARMKKAEARSMQYKQPGRRMPTGQ